MQRTFEGEGCDVDEDSNLVLIKPNLTSLKLQVIYQAVEFITVICLIIDKFVKKMLDRLVIRQIQRHLPIETRQLPVCKSWVRIYQASSEYQFLCAVKSKASQPILDIDGTMTIQLKHHLDFAMCCTAQIGHRHLIEFFVSLGANNWNMAMGFAADGGHRDLVEFFIYRGADDWKLGLVKAARGGYVELTQFFIAKGGGDWNIAMREAAVTGHRYLVDMAISNGADDWNLGLEGAVEGGQLDLVKFFKARLAK